ncbi:MAG: PDZ domain-containing protein, partial [Verrucomicrobia bacterium]|nr:PDZ domain-containing protein [Verrucomicrobiota bacterium]
ISLVNRIAEADIGANLTIDLVRDGQIKTVTAQVVEQPADLVARLNRKQTSPDPSGNLQTTLFAGIEVRNLTPRLRTEANVPANVNGVIVTSVDPNSAAAQALRPADVIEQVDRQPVSNVDEFQSLVSQLDPEKPVLIGIARNRQRSFVIIQPN